MQKSAHLRMNYGSRIFSEVWQAAMQTIFSDTTDAVAYLLRLDQSKSEVNILGFKKEHMLQAQDHYLKVEKETVNDPQIQVVLVSVDSLKALKDAYRNYFLDRIIYS